MKFQRDAILSFKSFVDKIRGFVDGAGNYLDVLSFITGNDIGFFAGINYALKKIMGKASKWLLNATRLILVAIAIYNYSAIANMISEGFRQIELIFWQLSIVGIIAITSAIIATNSFLPLYSLGFPLWKGYK